MSILGTMSDLLTTLGTNASAAPMVIPALAQTPNNTPPSSTAYPILAKALQTGLNKLGAGLKVDGKIGPKTDAAATSVLGSGWRLMTWGEILTKIVQKYRSGVKIGGDMGVQQSSMLGGIPTWVLLAGGGALLLLLMKKGKRRR